jgi:hypothetical protein
MEFRKILELRNNDMQEFFRLLRQRDILHDFTAVRSVSEDKGMDAELEEFLDRFDLEKK